MATAFRLRTYPEILASMFATGRVLLGKRLGTFVGSLTRTIFEACALQDADQYAQIARLLDLFSIAKAQGDDLDRRALDLGAGLFKELRRLSAQTSISQVSVGDGTLVASSILARDSAAAASTFTVQANTGQLFPAAGAVVLERGTAREERIVYTRAGDTFTVVTSGGAQFAHAAGGEVIRVAVQSILVGSVSIGGTSCQLATDTGAAWTTTGIVIFDRGTATQESIAFTRAGDVLTLGVAATQAHASNAPVILSTVGSDRAINTNLGVYAPATESNKQVNFHLVGGGTLLDGDFTSSLINVESDAVGAATQVGANAITQWVSPPFDGATVINPISATRGADRELDPAYRTRIRAWIQSLGLATALAIMTRITGVADEVTNQTVLFAQMIEPVNPGLSILYISDGTPDFALTRAKFTGRDVIIRDAVIGDARGQLSQYGPFDVLASPANVRTPRIFRSVFGSVATAVGANTLSDTSLNLTPNGYVGDFVKTDDDQFLAIASNTATTFTLVAGGMTPPLGSYAVFNFVDDPLTPGVHYNFNETNGALELVTPLNAHDALVAASDGADAGVQAYTYTTGLGATVQRTVNGDPSDFLDFPGIKATGTKVLVQAPTVVSPAFVIQIIPEAGYTVAQLTPIVQTVVCSYVNALGMGQSIVLAEIYRIVKALAGVADTKPLLPSANVPVPQNQLARILPANVAVV